MSHPFTLVSDFVIAGRGVRGVLLGVAVLLILASILLLAQELEKHSRYCEYELIVHNVLTDKHSRLVLNVEYVTPAPDMPSYVLLETESPGYITVPSGVVIHARCHPDARLKVVACLLGKIILLPPV